MPLPQEEIKRRINAARIIRGMSQAEFDALGAADGFGKGEMSRVERGELAFREGKHLAAMSRYLGVPAWWFTAEAIDLSTGPDQDPPESTVEQHLASLTEQIAADRADRIANIEDVKTLIDQQSSALREQARVLVDLRKAVDELREAIATQREAARRLEEMTKEAVQALPPSPPARARPSKRAGT